MGFVPGVLNGGVVLQGPAADGESGQVLATDGSGQLEFQDANDLLTEPVELTCPDANTPALKIQGVSGQNSFLEILDANGNLIANAGQDGRFGNRQAGDAFSRVGLAGANGITWGSGSALQDTHLARAAAGVLRLQGASSSDPAALSSVPRAATLSGGTNNNWEPGVARFIQASTSGGAQTVTGIAAGVHGQELILRNAGSDSITIKHQDTGSSEANRIITPTAEDVVLAAGYTAQLIYYAGSVNRWLVLFVEKDAGEGGSGEIESPFTLVSGAADEVPLTIVGHASQSSNLLELHDNSDQVLAAISSAGAIGCRQGGDTVPRVQLDPSTAAVKFGGGSSAADAQIARVAAGVLAIHGANSSTPAGLRVTWQTVSLTADTNDLSVLPCVALNVTLNGNWNLTGLTMGQGDGQVLFIRNVSLGANLTISHQSTSSNSENRFICPGAANLVLPQQHGAIFIYHGGHARWEVFATTLT